ncbi:hypothetical protein QFC22_000111 [Naganishia vaughanmartiniae]|uniref:Uncharacterized protein n=1 Tax=Naganishia vaughanmartiniae TaxID=1424756 RepID=A0ACC2XPH6_9TREE|nr:hypothetical protein QFC22_000111 [Naganishia vaughanmartiniae]
MAPIAVDERPAPPKYHEPVQGTVYHGDGREEALLKHLQSLPELQNNPGTQPVLDAIHEFGKGENRYLMSVGDTKGTGIEKLINEKKPKLVLELGSYVGYSAICFSRHLPKIHPNSVYPANWTGDAKEDKAGYISLEKSEVYAATARGAIELAGLGDVVKIVTGSSTPSLKNLRKTLNLPRPIKFDMVFIDHLKPLYTNDLKVMEEEGLIAPGTIIVADNVVKPGNPAYLSYVRATPEQKRAMLARPPLKTQPPVTPNPSDPSDWETAFCDGPLEETLWTPVESDGVTGRGDPDLVYSSEMIGGWDPYTGERDACEVSVCLRKESS